MEYVNSNIDAVSGLSPSDEHFLYFGIIASIVIMVLDTVSLLVVTFIAFKIIQLTKGKGKRVKLLVFLIIMTLLSNLVF